MEKSELMSKRPGSSSARVTNLGARFFTKEPLGQNGANFGFKLSISRAKGLYFFRILIFNIWGPKGAYLRKYIKDSSTQLAHNQQLK